MTFLIVESLKYPEVETLVQQNLFVGFYSTKRQMRECM